MRMMLVSLAIMANVTALPLADTATPARPVAWSRVPVLARTVFAGP